MKVEVKTSGSEYDIHIGNEILPSMLRSSADTGDEPCAAVVSSRVLGLHREYILDSLKSIKQCTVIEMDDSEANKNYNYAGPFFNRLIELGLNRKSCIIAIGGGVVGDFAGFLAALYMRGIKVIQVPTTLLAMVDSSVGGKTAVNCDLGKNIIGAFHQPSLVVSDVKFLETLPAEEIRNGLAEALKHGLIGDAASLDLFKGNTPDSINEKRSLASIAEASASFKASIVAQDEKEGGIRAILNFGHTVGHALESFMNYRGISHGEAVAFGMEVKTRALAISGMISAAERDVIVGLISRYGLLPRGIKISFDDLIEHMKYDKKNSSGRINFVTLRGMGAPVINSDIDDGALRTALDETIRTGCAR